MFMEHMNLRYEEEEEMVKEKKENRKQI